MRPHLRPSNISTLTVPVDPSHCAHFSPRTLTGCHNRRPVSQYVAGKTGSQFVDTDGEEAVEILESIVTQLPCVCCRKRRSALLRCALQTMGVVASVLVPPCIVGTGCCLISNHFNALFGCLLPIACELAHVVTDEALQSEGQLAIDQAIQNARHWSIVQFGIRSFSLNCCGRWNHVLDTIRRCLAPCSASFSGRMVHDVVVAFIQDSETDTQGLMILSKAHNGDLEIRFCRDLEEVDVKGKPMIFGVPHSGWWRALTESCSLSVQDLVDECSTIPPAYQPVSNNCHHFSKELWNWHARKLMEDGRRERLIRFPRGRCRTSTCVFKPYVLQS